MPVVVLVALFSGLATSVEAAALTCLYALFTQAAIHRDVSIRRDLLRVFAECVGGPSAACSSFRCRCRAHQLAGGCRYRCIWVEFTRAHIESRTAFLLALNIFLIPWAA